MYVREFHTQHSIPVLLLHGQVFDGRLFEPMESCLPNHRLLIPDLPAHGRSSAELVPALDDIAPKLEAELESRKVNDVFLVGYSLGSWHALGVALRRKVRVRGLYLLGPFAGADAAVLGQFAGLAKMARAGQLDWVEVFLGNCFPKAWADAHPATVAKARHEIRQASALVLMEELERFPSMTDWRPRLNELDVPCVVRVGSEDPSTPLAAAQSIASAIRGARLEVVPGVAHHLLGQDFEATATSIKRFVEGA